MNKEIEEAVSWLDANQLAEVWTAEVNFLGCGLKELFGDI